MIYVISDVDGTIANNRWRENLARERRWDEFHALAPEDKPYTDVILTLGLWGGMPGTKLILVTGREDKWREITDEWLDRFGVKYDYLLMRPTGDFRSDAVIKPELVNIIGAHPVNTLFILEDRTKMVTAWRALGFTCWQVREGGY